MNPPIEAPRDPSESQEARLKRMRMRSWRRGIKEMDLILGPFSDEHLVNLTEEDLTLYDQLLTENDQEIYPWITGAAETPVKYQELLGRIGKFARNRHTPVR